MLADDAYIRESILNPNAKIVAGYKPDVMPSFQGQISEEGILQLIVYIKSLAIARSARRATGTAAPAAGADASSTMAVNNEYSFTRTRS